MQELLDKVHQIHERVKDRMFWAARFSISSYNNLHTTKGRDRAELVEHLLVRYLSNQPGAKMINDKKTQSDPKRPIVIISRWFRKNTIELRLSKPNTVYDLPDTLLYDDGDFYAADKLKYTL